MDEETRTEILTIKWSESRGRDTYGYTICSLWVGNPWNKRKITSCNGGGYDMQGTVIGNWLAMTFPDRLRRLTREFYGLTFHDPKWRPGQYVPDTQDGRTVDELEAAGESLGLERYRAFYAGSSKVPTERHVVPLVDGATGFRSMEILAQAIGIKLNKVYDDKKTDVYHAEIGPMPLQG